MSSTIRLRPVYPINYPSRHDEAADLEGSTTTNTTTLWTYQADEIQRVIDRLLAARSVPSGLLVALIEKRTDYERLSAEGD